MVAHHLFLSYSRNDRELVDQLRRQLEQRGVDTFMDRDLELGLSWPERLEKALRETRAVAVLFGPAGLGRWQRREMYVALDRQVLEEKAGRAFPVVPVLLPQAREDDLGVSFLSLNTWVDLRRGVDAETVDALARMALGSADVRFEHPAGELLDVCPYRGLRPFRVEDSAFYFGREREVGELLERVGKKKKGGLIAVIGPSGSGKSSLVQAGLIPRLYALQPPAATWEAIVFRPGDEPFRSLARELAPILEPDLDKLDLIEKIPRLAATMKEHPEEPILQMLKDSRDTERILLVVDQFEEIVAPPASRETGRDFVRSLLRLQERSPVTLLFTLRADFYGEVIQLDESLSRLVEQQGAFHVRPPDREELARVIRGPAEKLRVGLEQGLVEHILDDVGTEPGRLPLLEFALERLWYRDKDSGTLTLDGYQSVGKVERAIAQKADEVYEGLEEEEQAALRRVTLRLVRLGEPEAGSLDTRQRVPLASLREAEKGPVREMVAARLLLTRGEPEEPVLEVAHESLIRHWERLRRWLDDQRAFLLWRQRLEESVRQWLDNARDASYLYSGRRLEEAEEEMRAQPELLDDADVEFIRASIGERRKRRYWIVAAAFLGVAVVAAAGVTVLQYRENVRHQSAIDARNLAQLSLAKLREGRPQYAAILAAEALRASEKARPFREPEAEAALREALIDLGGSPLPLPPEDKVKGAVVLVDGARVASETGDGRLRLTQWEWQAPTAVGRSMEPAAEHAVPIIPEDPDDSIPPPLRVRLSRDGRWMVQDRGGARQVFELVSIEGGEVLQLVEDLPENVEATIFADEERLVSATGTWRVTPFSNRFELTNGRTVTLVGHDLNRDENSQGAAFSPDERWVLTWSLAEVRLWDLSAPYPGASREPQVDSKDRVPEIDFQPAVPWTVEVADGQRPRVGRARGEQRECAGESAPVHEGDVKVFVFSPDGGRLFTAGQRDSGRLWRIDAEGSCTFQSVGLDDTTPASASFGAGRRWLAIGSSGGRAFLSDPQVEELRASARRLFPSVGEGPVKVITLSDDDRWLFAATEQGETRMWELEDGQSVYSVAFPDVGSIHAAAFEPDGPLRTDHDDGVRLWTLLPDEASAEKLIKLACEAAGRNLTCEEWRDAFGPGEPYRETCPDFYGPAEPCDVGSAAD